jgi:hypothetical protein
VKVYGVPAALDLAFLRGAELIQVCLGAYQLQFHFHPVGDISIQSGWELLDAGGTRIDGAPIRTDGAPYRLHELLSRTVVAFEVRAPEWFSITFDCGSTLRVFDDDSNFECFSLQPGNVFV